MHISKDQKGESVREGKTYSCCSALGPDPHATEPPPLEQACTQNTSVQFRNNWFRESPQFTNTMDISIKHILLLKKRLKKEKFFSLQ